MVGASGSAKMKKIVYTVVGFLVLVAIAPVAINSFTNTSTTGWSVTNIAVWGLIGVIFIIVLILTVLDQI